MVCGGAYSRCTEVSKCCLKGGCGIIVVRRSALNGQQAAH